MTAKMTCYILFIRITHFLNDSFWFPHFQNTDCQGEELHLVFRCMIGTEKNLIREGKSINTYGKHTSAFIILSQFQEAML